MKAIPFIIKLFTILRPLLREAIIAIKAVQILKRQMNDGGGNVSRLNFDLNNFFSSGQQAQDAINAFVMVIKKVRPELGMQYSDKGNALMLVAFLQYMKDLPKHERRSLLRELARMLIISRNRGKVFDDAQLDTAMQIAYLKVKDEDA